MQRIKKGLIILLSLSMLLGAVSCEAFEEAGLIKTEVKGLVASGTIEVVDAVASSELGGVVVEVYLDDGDTVKIDDPLFRLQDDLVDAQYEQASAALEALKAGLDFAKAALNAAQANVEYVEIQYELELTAARLADQPERVASWDRELPDEFTLPAWYFEKSEEIISAQVEVDAALEALEKEKESFDALIENTSYSDLQDAETRLSEARTAFLVAEEVLERAKEQGDEELENYAQDNFDAVAAELEAAQSGYDQILSGTAEDDLLEARGRLVVARERHETALDNLSAMLTGEDSLSVKLAAAAVDQAKAAGAQAEAGVVQAQSLVAEAEAGLKLIQVNKGKLVVYAAVSGVIRTRNIEPGEVLQPGVAAMVIDQLDKMTITVYFSEDQYGQIKLGDTANITVDSFPNESFDGVVVRIADRAEYTPRNVQTAEEMVTTVYAIE
ncbi:MAG: efflux RND transporter periplasmic adaptor subunit, partial [Anaerolineaceae bacterium]|nr:efflux RND transporter periplasmic adaptor subunit [Anaerolineaceae bacterium]